MIVIDVLVVRKLLCRRQKFQRETFELPSSWKLMWMGGEWVMSTDRQFVLRWKGR
jgi:hypothetical protein